MPVPGVGMKRLAMLSLNAAALLLAGAWTGQAAPYFPYDSIRDYYEPPPEQPAPPPSQQPAQQPVAPPQRPGQPIAVTAPPEFLFPAKLGFGVAVGVPYDMMYISEDYYYWQGGSWYRSSSFHGPWTRLGQSQLPPELRNQPLAKIRQLRDGEFRTYWKNKEHYQGKQFRPGQENKENPAASKQ